VSLGMLLNKSYFLFLFLLCQQHIPLYSRPWIWGLQGFYWVQLTLLIPPSHMGEMVPYCSLLLLLYFP
jgi:hypothetical protein